MTMTTTTADEGNPSLVSSLAAVAVASGADPLTAGASAAVDAALGGPSLVRPSADGRGARRGRGRRQALRLPSTPPPSSTPAAASAAPAASAPAASASAPRLLTALEAAKEALLTIERAAPARALDRSKLVGNDGEGRRRRRRRTEPWTRTRPPPLLPPRSSSWCLPRRLRRLGPRPPRLPLALWRVRSRPRPPRAFWSRPPLVRGAWAPTESHLCRERRCRRRARCAGRRDRPRVATGDTRGRRLARGCSGRGDRIQDRESRLTRPLMLLARKRRGRRSAGAAGGAKPLLQQRQRRWRRRRRNRRRSSAPSLAETLCSTATSRASLFPPVPPSTRTPRPWWGCPRSPLGSSSSSSSHGRRPLRAPPAGEPPSSACPGHGPGGGGVAAVGSLPAFTMLVFSSSPRATWNCRSRS